MSSQMIQTLDPTARWARAAGALSVWVRFAARFAVPAVGVLAGCSRSESVHKPDPRPNVLWIVWDTVRADQLSLYGHAKPTTPFLDDWAKDARVFDNCLSVSGTTAPSHASMFTGLMPTEHATDNTHSRLPGELSTVAELLQGSGYQTYLFAANPYISEEHNFTQGFDVSEHPWTAKYRQDALGIVQRKVAPNDRSSELPRTLQRGQPGRWWIKACGQLAQRGVQSWLQRRDQTRPYFVFLNYMEAHRPYIPSEDHRRRMMTPQQVAKSYQIDRSWLAMWAYTFGLRHYSREELEITAATYDATLAELDDLLRNLLTSLRAKGLLDNTVVILTSDHGEHLGDKHMLDHQFSLYQPLLRVPLVIHYPPRFERGRDRRPVMNHDLFPTVLELGEVDPPKDLPSHVISLLVAPETRVRVAEYPTPLSRPINEVGVAYPRWDPTPWLRSLRAITDGRYKYIWASDGRHELYDLRADPQERQNLINVVSQEARRLAELLDTAVAGFRQPDFAPALAGTLSEEELERLNAMGYLEASGGRPDEEPTTDTPATRPGKKP